MQFARVFCFVSDCCDCLASGCRESRLKQETMESTPTPLAYSQRGRLLTPVERLSQSGNTSGLPADVSEVAGLPCSEQDEVLPLGLTEPNPIRPSLAALIKDLLHGSPMLAQDFRRFLKVFLTSAVYTPGCTRCQEEDIPCCAARVNWTSKKCATCVVRGCSCSIGNRFQLVRITISGLHYRNTR